MEKRHLLFEFAVAMWGDWWARLSGPASVPAAALALWLPSDSAKAIFAFTAFACVWFTAYRLWKIERDKVVALSPPLKIKIHDGPAYESGTRDADGGVLPNGWVFLARLTGGEKATSRCQIILEDRNGHNHIASKLFDLRPGEQKDMPVLRFSDTSDQQESRAFIYMSKPDGEILSHGGALLIPPGRYRIKVLSAEAVPAILDVHLSKHKKMAGKWILEEVPSCPEKPKTALIASLRQWLPNPNLRKGS